jgi:cytochrome c-type biogenesis protein CcmE
MTRKKRRLMVLLLAGLGLGTATALTLTAFQDNLVFFLSPSDVVAQRPAGDRAFRLGGLVENGSVARHTGSDGRPAATFRVTDGPNAISVTYAGVLPDLFREGQGVVTLGRMLPDGSFRATEVLARHDETYMPPEVADALRRSGHWNPSDGAAPPAASWNTAPRDGRSGG